MNKIKFHSPVIVSGQEKETFKQSLDKQGMVFL